MQHPASFKKLFRLLCVYCFIQLNGCTFDCYGRAQVTNADTIVLHSEKLSVADGLSQGLILSMVQDKNGLMWFGTKDGLNKYDGYQFTVYRHEPENPYSLPDNYISHITEDENGNLWIGTFYKGLCVFDRASEKFYPVKLSNDNSGNPGIYEMKYANKRLIIQSNQLASYDVSHIYPGKYGHIDLSGSAIVINRNKYIAPHRLKDYSYGLDGQIMPDGSVWFSYPDSVFVFAIQSKEYLPIKSFSTALLGNDCKEGYKFYPLPQPNRLMCINNQYLVVFDTASNTVVKRSSTLNRYWPVLRVAVKDRLGNYFICAGALTTNYSFNAITYELQPIKSVSSIMPLFDCNGILWLSTNGFGVVKHDYRKQFFTTVKDYIHAVPHNSKGEIVRSINKELHFSNVYSKSTYHLLPAYVRNPTFPYLAYVMDNKGINYLKYNIGDNFYLISYNPSNGILKKQDLQFTSNWNGDYLFTDNNDNLWLEAEDTTNQPLLISINKNTLQKQAIYRFPVKNIARTGTRFLSSYWQDATGMFWFATLQGLFRFDPASNRVLNKWKHYQHQPGNPASLSTNKLFTICPDPSQPNKYLWLGTDGLGITRFEIATGNCIHFTIKDGLPNNVIYGILGDKVGNLWMSTNKGICVINASTVKSNKTQSKPLEIKGLFTSEDGLPGNEFNRYEYYKLPNGDLFFGGTEGGVVFNPEKVLAKEAPPSIILTGLSVYNKPVSHLTDSAIIQQNITYAKSITLPQDKNMFSISFAALEYRAVGKKQYKYYLENYDDTWIEAGSKNEATYTNLPPGTYTFHVKGKGSMSDWTENDASIKVIILPAWWQTWWFRLMVALIIIGSVYAAFTYRLAQKTKLLTIRNRIASDLHDEIGSTLSSISISSTIIQSKMKDSNQEVDKLLNQISSNTDNMMEAMSDIVWTINSKNDRFTNIINRMRAFAIETLEPKDCSVHFNAKNIPDDLQMDMMQRKNLYLIFKEAINNAAKYSECKNVWIDISLNGNKKLVMKIKDDGVGFAPLSPWRGAGGEDSNFGGNGLSNIQKRANELSGKLKIDTVIEQGTELSLEFMVRG